MKTPLVSVITPTYNRAYCIEATLDSALAQTCGDLEVLIIDDGSTDDTRDVVARRYGRERRVRYVRQENRGVSAARNHGHRLARGEYLAYLDSDDRWLPWKLDLQLACFRRLPEIGMVFTDIDVVDDQGRVVRGAASRSLFESYRRLDVGRPFTATVPLGEVAPNLADVVGDAVVRAGDTFSQMILGNLVWTSTAMIRAPAAAKAGWFDERLSHGEDYDYFLRVSREAPAAFADVATVAYRMGEPDQLTKDPVFSIRMATNYLRSIRRALDDDRARIRLSDEVVRSLLAATHAWIAEESAAIGQGYEAIQHLAQSLRCRRPGWQDARLLALAVMPAPMVGAVRSVLRHARRPPRDLAQPRPRRSSPVIMSSG
jgi:glycosyltransferase involved in cell wall biosynthesis